MSKPTPPDLREALERQLREHYREQDKYFPFEQFRADAANIMPDKANEPRFPFVVLRLWMESPDELPANMEKMLPNLYDEFVAAFPWHGGELPPWTSTSLVERGLYHIQMSRVTQARPRHAIHALQQIGRLASKGVSL